MTAARVHLAAAQAIAERDLRVFLSYRARPVTLLVGPVATVTLFFYVSRLVKVETVGSSDGYFAYVVVGIATLDVLASTLGVPPATLRQELVAGTFERLVVSPFGAVGSIVATMAFPLLQSLVLAGFTILFAAAVFGLPLAWPSILLSPPAAVLSALAFAPFGIVLVALVLVVKQTIAGASVIITALSVFAGVYFPVALLPEWIRWVSKVQPLTPALALQRHLVSATPTAEGPWLEVAKLAGFAAVLLPPSLWVLSRALAHCRSRGTVIEY
jgi:ABC-2 type transport system permease protein